MDGDSIRVATAISALGVIAFAVIGYISASPNAKPYVSGSRSRQLALLAPARVTQNAPALGRKTADALSDAGAGNAAKPDAAKTGAELAVVLERARAAVVGTTSKAGSPATYKPDASTDAPSALASDAGSPPSSPLGAKSQAQVAAQNRAPKPLSAGVDAGLPAAEQPSPASKDDTQELAVQEGSAATQSATIVSVKSSATQVAVLPLGVGDPFAAVRNVPTYSPSRSARRSGAYSLVGRSARPVQFARWTEGDRPPISILESRGKVLILYAFQGWCPGCQRRGFPVTKALEKIYALRSDVEFVYVQSPFEGHFVNDFERAERERFNWNITRPVAQDSVNEDGRPSLMRAYRSAGTPWHIIIDKGGVIRFNDFTRDAQGFKRLIDTLL